jgi:hypothetical protein
MSNEDASIGKAKGGYARAEVLSPKERSDIAKKAARMRWGKTPKAEYKGSLMIGDHELPCFVLNDGRRVISGRGMTTAIGMKGRGQGTSRIASLLRKKSSNNNDLALAIENPVVFDSGAPMLTQGYEAPVLVQLCEAILDAKDSGALKTDEEERYYRSCYVLTRAFAKVGIIALVDEATGYQRDRANDALAKILEAFIAKELQPYIPTFPPDYYEELFRLRGLEFPRDKVQRPQYFGVLTNDIVYRRLAPGVLDQLKNVVPRNEAGRPTAKYFQKLTSNLGYPKLREHLGAVVAVMKLSDTYPDFISKLDRIKPRYGQQMSFDYEATVDTGTGI